MKDGQSENSELFDQLYRDNQAKVYRLALGLAGNVHDAEDITQEAFYRAFRSFHTFRQESSFFTWIYRITLNVANDYLKHRTKLPVYTLTEDLGFSIDEVIDRNPSNNPETELLALQVRVKCLHCLTECLPIKQRRVFCLALMLELPQKQVAEILECSVSAVKTTLHRAKKRWFGYMEDKCRLINKSNPCNCKQFVRFGLKRGWVVKDLSTGPDAVLASTIKEEIGQLQTLSDFYRNLYRDAADKTFAQRLREGIKNKEWEVLS